MCVVFGACFFLFRLSWFSPKHVFLRWFDQAKNPLENKHTQIGLWNMLRILITNKKHVVLINIFCNSNHRKNKFWKKTTGQLLAAPSRVCVFTPPKFNGWNLKMMVSKRNLLFQGLISGSMFNFRGVTHVRCSNLRRWSRVTVLILVGQWSQMVLTDERD